MFAMFSPLTITLSIPLGDSGFVIHNTCLRCLSLRCVRVAVWYVFHFYASQLSVSTTFLSVTRGPWLGEGFLGGAGTPLSLIRSYNGLLA